MKTLLRYFLLVTSLFVSFIVDAQDIQTEYFKKYTVNGLSLNAGYTFGDFTKGYKFSNNILERKFISYGDLYSSNWDWHIKMHYRFKKKYAFEAGFIRTETDFAFADKAFAANISDTNYIGGFNFTQDYVAPTISAYYFISLPNQSQYLMNFYIAGGMNFNINMNKKYSEPAPFYTNTAQQHIFATNEDLNLSIQAKSFFTQYYIETGLNFCLYRCNLYLGAKYSFSQNMMSGTYQHLQNGNIIHSDYITSPANYLLATFRVGYILFQNWEKPKKHHYKSGPDLKTKYIKPKY